MSLFMRRALDLAACGELRAHPNPMVGAVIVAPDGRVIGEGFHRCCGQTHAEVNAVNSVSPDDRHILAESTIYVTLEPCSHYGKTPPCAELIIRTGIPNVVIAMVDPFAKVAGRGIQMLRQAGINVSIGDMEAEARRLNRRFITAHTLHRPWVTLKWAQSADGFIDGRASMDQPPAAISTPLSLAAVHRLRATHDAILVGSETMLADRPSLTTRFFAGPSPRRFVADHRHRIDPLPDGWFRAPDAPLPDMLSQLYSQGITSLLVEGGAALLQSFLDLNLYDDIVREVNPNLYLADNPFTTPAPHTSLL